MLFPQKIFSSGNKSVRNYCSSKFELFFENAQINIQGCHMKVFISNGFSYRLNVI